MTDVQGVQPEGSIQEPSEFSAGDLREAGKELVLAASRLGIQADEPLGVFTGSLGKVLDGLAGTMTKFQAGIESQIVKVGGIAESEVKKLQAANDLAGKAIEEAKKAKVATDDARDRVINKVVKDIGPEVIGKLGPWLVQRQTELDRRRQWRRLMAGCVLGFVLGGLGYQWREFEDYSIISRLSRCKDENVKAKFPGDKESVPICRLNDLLVAPGGSMKDRFAEYLWGGQGEAKPAGRGG